MNKLCVGKRGIFFTVGLMFLTLVVLGLAILIFHNAQEYEGMVAKLAVLDRVYDLDTSIQRSLGDIFELKSGISINITDSGISFEERLPNNNILILNNSLHQFKRFIESNLSNINLTITNIAELPLMITPNNIAYKHKDNRSDIEVLPTSINFDGYSIFIDTDMNVTCNWNGATLLAGGLNLSLDVDGDFFSCSRTDEIDTSVDNEIRVDKKEDTSINLIIIKVDNNRLLINLTQDISVKARTTILTNMPQVGVMADSLSLEFDFGEFGVTKESEVRII